MAQPRVSILTPCYQQAHFLGLSVASGLAQTADELEVIIVDDGSTDATAEVAQGLVGAHPDRVRFIRQANAGQGAAREAARREARGEFLVLLDADDLLERDMVAACLAHFQKHPKALVVAGDVMMIDAEGAPIGPLLQTGNTRWPGVLVTNPLGGLAGVMVRADAVESVGGLSGAAGCEDWDVWAKLARRGAEFRLLRRIVARYRRAQGSHSTQTLAPLDAYIAMLDRARLGPRRYATLRNARVVRAIAQYYGAAVTAAEANQKDRLTYDDLYDGLSALAKKLVGGGDNARLGRDAWLEGLRAGGFTRARAHPSDLEGALWAALGSGYLDKFFTLDPSTPRSMRRRIWERWVRWRCG